MLQPHAELNKNGQSCYPHNAKEKSDHFDNQMGTQVPANVSAINCQKMAPTKVSSTDFNKMLASSEGLLKDKE